MLGIIPHHQHPPTRRLAMRAPSFLLDTLHNCRVIILAEKKVPLTLWILLSLVSSSSRYFHFLALCSFHATSLWSFYATLHYLFFWSLLTTTTLLLLPRLFSPIIRTLICCTLISHHEMLFPYPILWMFKSRCHNNLIPLQFHLKDYFLLLWMNRCHPRLMARI